MIYYSVPFDSTKNIGIYYNKFVSILPNDNDWACFIDADAMFTTDNYDKQLNDIINKYKDAGVFVGVTNRVACKWQVVENVNKLSNNIKYHQEFGKQMYKNFYDKCEDVTYKPKLEVLSGVLILIKKQTWIDIKGFDEQGMLGIDNDLHWKCQQNNIKVYKMNGVYVYHWYRNNDKKNKLHLI